MKLGVLRERAAGERRVSLAPDAVKRLIGDGHTVTVQSGAGTGALFDDADYLSVGADIAEDLSSILTTSDVVFGIRGLGMDDASDLQNVNAGTVLIAQVQPLSDDPAYYHRLADCGVTLFNMGSIPRISRSQSMDVLSSMSTVSGYRSVLLAAERLPKFFPLFMTAAGTIPPAKVLVLGAGVAGLQAIATARRLGAVVQAFDTRPIVREQVESLGASFLTVDVQTAQTQDGYARALADDLHRRELEALAKPVAEADVVITTALIPGQRAPILITTEMVRSMRPGSVIVDLAAEASGNCELTEPGETVVRHGVTIAAPFNVPSQLPIPASQLYARNVTTFFQHCVSQGLAVSPSGRTELDLSDEIVHRTCLILNGEIVNESLQRRLFAERS